MGYFLTALRTNPELAIFLTLAGGFVLGRIKIGSFQLGNVVGTLLAGVLIGQLGIQVPTVVKVVFFDLFLFATGYKVGPQFIRGLGKSALPQVALTRRALRDQPRGRRRRGEDPWLRQRDGGGAPRRRVHRVDRHRDGRRRDHATAVCREAETSRLLNNIAVAYAVTYLVGTTARGLVPLQPRAAAAQRGPEGREPDARARRGRRVGATWSTLSGYREWDIRAYRLADAWAGQRVADAGAVLRAGPRVRPARPSRGPDVRRRAATSSCGTGDTVAVAARRWVVAGDVVDRQGNRRPCRCSNSRSRCWTSCSRTSAWWIARSRAGARSTGEGVALLKLVRGGEQIPFTASTPLNRGDLLRIAGAAQDVERAGAR